MAEVRRSSAGDRGPVCAPREDGIDALAPSREDVHTTSAIVVD